MKVLLYFFIIIMILEAIVHSHREGMSNPILAKLQAMEEYYDDEE